MTVDSSSLLAIFYQEPGYETLQQKLEAAPVRIISACTLVESYIVVGGRSGEPEVADLTVLVETLSIEVVDFTAAQAELAREAFLRFGKGKHPARLNLGDCLTYALAMSSGEPLLFVGNDFGQTDVLVA